MNFFSKNLRYLRAKHNLTQKEMLPLFGIRNTTWSNYEKAVSEPDIKRLVIISKYFGVTLDELIASDLAANDADYMEQQSKTRSYVTNDTAPLVEEQLPGWTYIFKEITKLRKDVEAIKRTAKK